MIGGVIAIDATAFVQSSNVFDVAPDDDTAADTVEVIASETDVDDEGNVSSEDTVDG